MAVVWSSLLASSGYAQGRKPSVVIREAEFSGYSYLSLNDVAEALQGRLSSPSLSDQITLSFRNHEVQFVIGSNKVTIDGGPASVDPPPVKDPRGVWVPRSFFTGSPLATEFQRRIDLGPIEKAPKAASEPSAKLPPPMVPPSTIPKEPVVDAPAGPALEPAVVEPAEPAPPAHAVRRIVIDPGHGGKDPGAIGSRGTAEKDINLWMANELADALRAKNFEVLLTRTDDSFIPLAARSALANRYKADLFISVHCNASISAKLNGFEVYFLSEKASNPHAEAVARLENAALEFEGKKPSNEVQVVLQSLMKNANINRAAQLGAIIDRQVARQLSQADLGVKQAAFYVLRGAQMPAVLIELGFLSNRKEERLLESPAHRRRLVRAIETSILEYDRKQQEAAKQRG
jgi:N-acetylmuramoyl-L-alanine amidase